MNIFLLSDLHYDHWVRYGHGQTLLTKLRDAVAESEADCVVLAGDVCNGPDAVEFAVNLTDKTVLLVAGNHDHYGHDIVAGEAILKEKAAMTPNVKFLEKESLELDGVRFLGTTLWTNFELFGEDDLPYVALDCQFGLNDFNVIRDNGDTLTASSVRLRHQSCVTWLATELNTPYPGTTVVVTHFAPHRGSLADYYASNRLSGYFVSHYPELVTRSQLWLHGHTHDFFDYQAEGARIVCRPLGYPNEGNLETLITRSVLTI